MKNLSKTLLSAALVMSSITIANAAGSYGVEPQTQAFLSQLEGGQPIETLSVVDARNVLINAQKGAKLAPANVETKVINIAGENIELTVIKPLNAPKDIPVFMYFHGGGWVLGDYQTHERLIRDLVDRSGAAAVYVNYTPSPEAQYPTAINQAYEATKWVAKHGDQIGVDGSRLAVAGNSVGGNMAAVVSLKAKENDGPDIRFQLLLWPVTDSNFNNTSYQEYGQGHFLTTNMMKWFWDNYTTSAEDRAQIYASPLRATVEELKGLPPALIQTAEKDVLRDEGEAYGRKLMEAGVKVTSTRYNGMIHDFGLLNVLSDVDAVQQSLDQAGHQLRLHLE
jgi:acetyl esterase/lipase